MELKKCSNRHCKKEISENENYAAFQIRIQDAIEDHGMDGEVHEVYLCQSCYLEKLEPDLSGHVKESYHLNMASAYGQLEAFTVSEERRLSPKLKKELLKRVRN